MGKARPSVVSSEEHELLSLCKLQECFLRSFAGEADAGSEGEKVRLNICHHFLSQVL